MATARPNWVRQPLDLPPDRIARVVGTWRDPALLESGSGFGDAGRWSILTARPRWVFEAVGGGWTRTPSAAPPGVLRDVWHPDPLSGLADTLHAWGLAETADEPDPDLTPFLGGLIGYLGYDLAPLLERLPRKAPRDTVMPDLRFGLYDTAVTVDHATGAVELWAHDLNGDGRAATEARADRWRRALARRVAPLPRSRAGPLVSNFTERDYLDAVRKALDYIAAGDIFQVNLSQRFEARGVIDPLDLYLRLKARSPAPFGAFLRWQDPGVGVTAVVSASPEWFYQTRGDRIVTRPIKGTRPRGATPEADARLAAELAASPKDRAELTMIVDLERNDLGRVCRYGSVRVTDALAVETFAQVHHLVATVEGRLRPDVGPVDVVRAVFPGGSITGAPKIRAMQIIDELEPTRRGVYTGAIGYFSRGGTSAFNIAIRTILVEGDRATFQVGGGIVADSDPSAEYHETLHKGRALREVLGGLGG